MHSILLCEFLSLCRRVCTNDSCRNHPIIKDDGVLAAFLTEPSFETWRKNSPISLDEESASKKVDKVEEMSIPSDFDDKIAYVTIQMTMVNTDTNAELFEENYPQ